MPSGGCTPVTPCAICRGSRPRLGRRRAPPALLVLDDLHRLLAGPPSVDLVVTLVDQLPPGWSVAIAQRQSTSLPTSRWQATDPSFARIGISDLALDADEAGQLLRSIGLAASDELIGDVLDRAEGWPGGVFLARP